MAKIYIDNNPYEVAEGKNLLETCLSLGLDLPYFCWHPALGSIGACRQCALVQYKDEEDSQGRIVMGCMTEVSDGARFSLGGEKAQGFRESIIEALMINHPHDCPVCAEGGECHLQDMTVMAGHRDRRYDGKKRTFRNQYLGPLVHHEMNRCITCYRCVRFYRDYADGTDLSEQASRDHVYFGRQSDGILESEFSGNLVEVCPTGVFTDKPLAHDYTRKWDLQSAPSLCTGCALGCNTMPGERYGKLKRIHNRFNHEVNGYFLCDRGRYGGTFVNSDKRLSFAGQRQPDGSYRAIDKTSALGQLVEWCGPEQRVAAIGSPRASLETNYLLRRLAGDENFYTGFGTLEQALVNEVRDQLCNSSVPTPSIKEVESADAVLILGEDVTNTAPRLALALRQSVRNQAFAMADKLGLHHWQDAAVRNLAQDKRSPLFIAAVAETRLDDIADESITLAPEDIARLGLGIAAALGATPAVNDLDDRLTGLAQRIAEALKGARRPLIVSGTGCLQQNLIQIGSRIAHALNEEDREPMLSYCLPECNSMGLALLSNGAGSSPEPDLDSLSQRVAKGKIDTLIIAENDLYRRAASQQIDDLLNGVKQLVVIDALDNPTLSRAHLALPAATFIEAEGTLVSSEGRAQRHYPVFLPAEDRQPTWAWLLEIGQSIGAAGFEQLQHFDQVEAACAADIPALGGITQAGPLADFRDQGLRIPRQPLRYSGRTAMRANISVQEPQPPTDAETPLSWSMEGLNGTRSRPLMPFAWAPGWNSNQSVSKYQTEVGGPLKNSSPGVRLIEPAGSSPKNHEITVPAAYRAEAEKWLLVPLYRIFGSEELSVEVPAIAELTGEPQLELNPDDAQKLGVAEGDGISVEGLDLEVRLNASLMPGCAGFPMGIAGLERLVAGLRVPLQKAANWRPPEQVIASDRGRQHV